MNEESSTSRQVAELYQRVQTEAVRATQKEGPAALSLMDMLNTFDIVVANEAFKNRTNSQPQTPNGNEVHNQVYRMILKTERDKAFKSISGITQEIKSIKSKNHTSLTTRRVFHQVNP